MSVTRGLRQAAANYRVAACAPRNKSSRSYQFVWGDWQISHALAGCIENGVRDCGRRTDNSNFTNAARAEIRHMRIWLTDEIDVGLRRVCVHCNVVFGEVRVNNSAGLLVGNRGFHQSCAKTEQHSAYDLAPGEARVDHSAHVIHADRTFYSHLPKRIDVHIDKDSAV